MPSSRIEAALQEGNFEITDAARSPSGVTAPYKLRLRLADGLIVSAKFKRAPDNLDGFNNSPRREIAAYEIQKLFLDEPDYVVPPSVITCLPVEENKHVMPELEPHEGTNCAFGVLAYWIEGLTDNDVIDENRWKRDQRYRESLGNLNALTVLIGHQDSIGTNIYRSKDPVRQRAFSVDNGLAFEAMGLNPIRFFSSKWSAVRVKGLPTETIARLKRLEPAAFQKFHVVAQFERQGKSWVAAAPTAPIDANEGVRRRDDVIQFGLTAAEITEMNVRLVRLLGEVDAGEVKQSE